MLRLCSIHVHGPDTSVRIQERPGADLLSADVGLVNSLWLDITAANERTLPTIWYSVEHRVARDLAAGRQARWLTLDAVATVIGAVWQRAAFMGLSANQAIAVTAVSVPGFVVVFLPQSLIPAIEGRTIDLRVVNHARPAGGGRRGGAAIDLDSDSPKTIDTGTSVSREGGGTRHRGRRRSTSSARRPGRNAAPSHRTDVLVSGYSADSRPSDGCAPRGLSASRPSRQSSGDRDTRQLPAFAAQTRLRQYLRKCGGPDPTKS